MNTTKSNKEDKGLLRVGTLSVSVKATGEVLFAIPMVIAPEENMGKALCLLATEATGDTSDIEYCIFVKEIAVYTKDLEDYIALSAIHYIVNNKLITPKIPPEVNMIALLTMFKDYTRERAINIMDTIVDTECVALESIEDPGKRYIESCLHLIVEEAFIYDGNDDKDIFFEGVDNYIPLVLHVDYDVPYDNVVS